ncbi:MAG: hypothetical protein IIU83_02270 [Fibrobacteraceae bacterium]|nr:hypothetical protein [Fibrobacteraceae bacterium]
MKKWSLVILAVLLFQNFSNAQFLQIRGAFVPSSTYHEKSGDAIPKSETNFRKIQFSTGMPFYFKRDSVEKTFSMWMGILTGSFTHLPFKNIPNDYPEEVVQALLMLNNIQKLKGENYLSFSFGGGVMGEREHLNENTVIYMTGLNYYHRFWNRLELGGGLFITNMFGHIFIYPMPHFQFSLGKQTVFLFNQSETSVKHHFNDVFTLGLIYEGDGTLTLVERHDEDGKREKKLFQAGQQIFGLKPEFAFKKGKYGITSTFGYAYNRNYRLIDRKFIRFLGSIFRDSPYTEREPYFSLQLKYRFF